MFSRNIADRSSRLFYPAFFREIWGDSHSQLQLELTSQKVGDGYFQLSGSVTSAASWVNFLVTCQKKQLAVEVAKEPTFRAVEFASVDFDRSEELVQSAADPKNPHLLLMGDGRWVKNDEKWTIWVGFHGFLMGDGSKMIHLSGMNIHRLP